MQMPANTGSYRAKLIGEFFPMHENTTMIDDLVITKWSSFFIATRCNFISSSCFDGNDVERT
jgi:hypothetical protein